MPRVYRSMLAEGTGPRVGRTAKELGVRIPEDINPDENNFVRPEQGGMSVAPRWQLLPTHRIPRRLRHLAPDAVGSNEFRCWRYGEGQFADGEFAESLALRVTKAAHGNVAPSNYMPLSQFEDAIAATRLGWRVDEERGSM